MFYGSWEALEELGSGGQGMVYLARQKNDALTRPDLAQSFGKSLRDATSERNLVSAVASAEKIFDLIREFCKEAIAKKFAVKVLRPSKDDGTRTKALQRLKNEVATLEKVKHPSLINIVDHKIDEGWFVMDYYPATLAGSLGRTKGDLLASLRAIRPIVDAVATLHKDGYVHRDIKPDNVFVASDDRLVLGDFGLVVQMDDRSGRVTDTYENVGSRDWMPGWALGMKLDDVKPTFDVFSLGKLLWAMVSGREKLRLWYLHKPEFEIEQMFPDDASIKWGREILDKCIVEDEVQCLPNAGELLKLIDIVIRALRQGGQLPIHGPIRCRICCRGEYTDFISDAGGGEALACNYCGNVQSFSKVDRRPGWK